ncbi:hypothetical protein Bca52824_032251 [Brassica carinata]|uniref:RNase H type-1 domain-containing protein n=1 Tax=Brassica carinata TaxID=52824 RepID=A0A8X7V4Y9_BRACI|nr:hypothetical protein Bca52824_032251 [Brassica carinata]
MLAISSSSTLPVTEPNLMVVLPFPFPTPTTQVVHLKPALPLTDLTARSPPEPPDPPDPPEPQVPPSKHCSSIILWKVSAAAQPHSTHPELDSGDPTSAAPPQPPLLAKEFDTLLYIYWSIISVFSVKSSHLGLCTSPSVPRHLSGQASRKAEDISSTICKTDTAWSKDRKVVALGWVVSGTIMAEPSQGSATQVFLNPPLIVEALAMRSTLCKALSFDFTNLKVFFDNSTLIRDISGEPQSKEIIGIMEDFRVISSGFATIWFFHLPRSGISVSNGLAKRLFKLFFMCNGLLELDHLWALSMF